MGAVDAMGPDFVTPLKNHEEVTISLAKMFAAAPKDKIKAVFDATPGVQDLNSAWYAQMPKADADATFEAFKQLADVVKASPEKAIAPVAAPSMDGPVGAAAKKLADASYPMLQKVNWANTGVLNKYVTNTPANKAGISALLDAGLAMDMKTVQGATQAHLDAVSAVDGSLLTPLANHEAVTVAIAKLIASAPPAKIKAVFDTEPSVEGLNFDWFSTMSVPDAVKCQQASGHDHRLSRQPVFVQCWSSGVVFCLLSWAGRHCPPTRCGLVRTSKLEVASHNCAAALPDVIVVGRVDLSME